MTTAIIPILRGFLADHDERWLAEDVEARDWTCPTPSRGRVETGAWWARIHREVFADVRNDPTRMTIAGSRAAVEWTLRGRHIGSLVGEAPSGLVLSIPMAAIFEIADEEIQRLDLYYDALGVLRQAGAPLTEIGAAR